jgi:MFS family permease
MTADGKAEDTADGIAEGAGERTAENAAGDTDTAGSAVAAGGAATATAGGTAGAGPHRPVLARTVRGAPFRLLWTGQTISVLGDGMALVAVPLLVLRLSGSPVLAALAAAVQPLAYLAAGLVAGPVVDRADSRVMMIGCDCLRAGLFGLMAWLVWVGAARPWSLLALAVAAACFGVVFDTAYAVLVQEMVDADNLLPANSRLELSNQLGLLVGPAVAGTAASVVGIQGCILLNALSYGGSILMLVAIRRDRRPARVNAALTFARVREELVAGLRLLAAHRVVRTISSLQALINFAVAAETLIIFYSVRTLHGSPVAVSLVVSGAAAGGMLGAALAGPLGRGRPEPAMIAWSVSALALALLAASAAWHLVWLGAANVGIGAASVLATVNIRTLRQRVVRPEFLARVTSAARTVAVVAYPAGAVLAGLLTSAAGGNPRPAFAAAGVLGLASAALAHRLRRRNEAWT